MKGKGMTELLFLVSRSHADILSHLSHEFVGGDVHVLFDRRHGERRHTRYGAGAARARRGRERRLGERRARRATERELRSIGYSIVTLEPTEGRSVPVDLHRQSRRGARGDGLSPDPLPRPHAGPVVGRAP
jgi:hypothetical protein